MTAGATRGAFLSYRREETCDIAGRLADWLIDSYGPEQVFIDVQTIEPGDDFATVIAREIASCRVLLALIGPIWLTTTDRWGLRRLDNPGDFVVLEIRVALERGIHVIPVLVDGASMPHRGDLPEELQGLVRRQAFRLDFDKFSSDITRLLDVVDRMLSNPSQKITKPTVRAYYQSPPLVSLIPFSPTRRSRLRPRLHVTAAIVLTLVVVGSIVLLARTITTILSSSSPEIAEVTVGDGPWGVAVSPDGRYAYITNRNSDSVSVIDTGTNTVTATIDIRFVSSIGIVDDEPTGVAISPDGRHAYITNTFSGLVSAIETESNTITANFPGFGGPVGVAVSPDGRYAYVTNYFSDSVSVIDTGLAENPP